MCSLSVVIPTLNEEKDIRRCLESVKFANTILVVDCGSTDKTTLIAKQLGAKVITNKFENFAQQRQFGDDQVNSDWILSIDADIEVPQKTAAEILRTIKDTKYSAFKVGRENIIWGKVIRHTDWSPKDDCHIRLYKKGSGKWESEVHELFVTKEKIGVLKNNLIHHNYDSISEFIQKMNSYSDFEAQKRYKNRQRFSFWSMLWEAKKDFLKRFVYKLGFLDEERGLFLSILQAIYYLCVNIKLYQLEQAK